MQLLRSIVCFVFVAIFFESHANAQARDKLTPWGPWGPCVAECGGGMMYRTRECIEGSNKPECEVVNERECNTHPCAPDLPPTPEPEERFTTEKDFTAIPEAPETMTTTTKAVKLIFGKWGNWTSCSVSCGVGIRRRERRCINAIDDERCLQTRTKRCERKCTDDKVKLIFGKWGNWTSCSVSCGVGIRRRERRCINALDDEKCLQTRTKRCERKCTDVEVDDTSMPEPPPSPEPSVTPMSTTEMLPTATPRSTTTPVNDTSMPELPPSPEPSVTPISTTEMLPTATPRSTTTPVSFSTTEPTTVSKDYGPWSAWTICTASCKGGSRFRVRECSNEDGSQDCEESIEEPCNTQRCDVDDTSMPEPPPSPEPSVTPMSTTTLATSRSITTSATCSPPKIPANCATNCPRTCDEPSPRLCDRSCNVLVRCVCPHELVQRSDMNRTCLALSECPSKGTSMPEPQPEPEPSVTPMSTTEMPTTPTPRSTPEGVCTPPKVFASCASFCPPTCDVPEPLVCSRACNAKILCVCPYGMVQRSLNDTSCVIQSECFDVTTTQKTTTTTTTTDVTTTQKSTTTTDVTTTRTLATTADVTNTRTLATTADVTNTRTLATTADVTNTRTLATTSEVTGTITLEPTGKETAPTSKSPATTGGKNNKMCGKRKLKARKLKSKTLKINKDRGGVCTWVIAAPKLHRVKVVIQELGIMDTLTLFEGKPDGEIDEEAIISEISGGIEPGSFFISIGRQITLRLQGGVDSNPSTFNIQYIAEEAVSDFAFLEINGGEELWWKLYRYLWNIFSLYGRYGD